MGSGMKNEICPSGTTSRRKRSSIGRMTSPCGILCLLFLCILTIHVCTSNPEKAKNRNCVKYIAQLFHPGLKWAWDGSFPHRLCRCNSGASRLQKKICWVSADITYTGSWKLRRSQVDPRISLMSAPISQSQKSYLETHLLSMKCGVFQVQESKLPFSGDSSCMLIAHVHFVQPWSCFQVQTWSEYKGRVQKPQARNLSVGGVPPPAPGASTDEIFPKS